MKTENTKYKDSGLPYVGNIPSDWKVLKGKVVLELLSRPVRPNDEIVTCFRDGEVVLRKERREDGFTMSDKEIGYQGINKGDIVIHGMDGFAGAIGVSKSTGKGTPVYVVCQPKHNESSRYLVYYLRTLAMNNVFLALSTGIRERSCDLRWNKISVLPFIIPSDKEQQRIADFLDKKCAEIDELSALQETMIAELKRYKQSVITEAVTGKWKVENGKLKDESGKMKDSGIPWIGEIPSHWEVNLLGSIFVEHKLKNDGMLERNLLSLSYGKIIRKNIDAVGGLLPMSYEGYNIIDKDDIVLRMTDLQNDHKSLRSGLCKERGIITSAYITIRSRQNNCCTYMHYLIHTYDICKVFYGMGDGVRQGINYSDIKNIRLIVPPLSEQQAIADYLDEKCSEIDELIAIKQQKIEQLKEYKKSVIFEYVTGKKEVES